MVSRWSPKPEAGVRFSSPLPNNTPLAQWLEQNAHNVLVTGSSPVGSTKNKSKLALDILTNQCYIVYVIT